MPMSRERESYLQLLEFTPALRRRVQDTIDELIDLLDAIDAAGEDREDDDPDEDLGQDDDASDDAPSLGATEAGDWAIGETPFGCDVEDVRGLDRTAGERAHA